MSQPQIPLETCNARYVLAQKGCVALGLVVVLLIILQAQHLQWNINEWFSTSKSEEQLPETIASKEKPDYRDADSDSSTLGKRRYQRGGRKRKGLQTVFPDGEACDGSGNEAEMASELLDLPSKPSTEPGKPSGTDFATGIRAFNLKRADETTRRPMGIKVDRGENDDQTSGSKNDAEGQETRKPVSIRLDLNLELEIFLRAKIKGDITITFLE